jgi:hypothetical protein
MSTRVKGDNIWITNEQLIRGFFDADGSFQAKIYHGNQKQISFHVNMVFTQKTDNKSLLEGVVNYLHNNGGKSIDSSRFSKITDRVIINDSGESFGGSSVCIAFSNPAGQHLLKVWQKHPPNAPTKLLDYRIACQLYRARKVGVLSVVNEILRNPSEICEDTLTAGLALLYLRFQMYAAKNTKVKRTSIKDHYDIVNASKEQVNKSIVIGEKLMSKIREEQQLIAAKPSLLIPRITEDYLLGYHIALQAVKVQVLR